MVVTRKSVGVKVFLGALLFVIFCSSIGFLVLAVDNETSSLTDPADEVPLTEEIPETIVLPEESAELSEENVAVSMSAELVANALEDYEEKITEKTAEVLSDAEPTDVVRVLVRYTGDSADDADLSRVDVSVIEMTVADAAALLEEGDVAALEVDQPVDLFTDVVPWGVNRTEAPDVWGVTTGSGIAVGIVDTGIVSHADLNVAGGASMVGGSYADTHGHGTAVAGVVAAVADSAGIVGVAPDVDLYAIKIMNGSSGQLSDVVAGIDWAINNDMNILVMSFGIEEYSQILEDAIDDAADAGILLIAAAGNDGADVRYPAAYADVVAVGATDSDDDIAPSSNTGPELELVAPGVHVNTTALLGYAALDGTSLAAPHVAGVAALVWAHNTSLSASQVRNLLRSTALDLGDAGRDDTYGYGLIQASLDAGNSSPINDSYFYEVWNITGYATGNETFTFWMNGTGTYEDLNFSLGLYLITMYLPNPVNKTIWVMEEGIFTILTAQTNGTFRYSDGYSVEGNSSDGAVWLNDPMNVSLNTTGISFGAMDGECYDSFLGSLGHYNYCWFPNSGDQEDCDGDTSLNLLNCEDHAECDTGTMGQTRVDVFSTSAFTGSAQKSVDYFDFCGSGSLKHYRTETQLMVVMSSKQSVCVNSTHYAYQSGTGVTYLGPVACSGTCSNASTFSTSNRNTPLTPPCVAGCTANGTINVAVNVGGTGYQNANVFVNNVSKGKTSSIGSLNGIAVSSVSCGTTQSVQVRCADNVTVCATKTATTDIVGDVDSLSFDCTLKCGGNRDLSVQQSNVWVNVGTDTVILTVDSEGVTQNNVVVNVTRQGSNGLLANGVRGFVNVTPGSSTNVTVSLSNLDDGDYIHVWLDYTDLVKSEESNTNNYLFRPAIKGVRTYFDIELDQTFKGVEPLLEEYLGSYVEEQSSPTSVPIYLKIRMVPQSWLTGVRIQGPLGEIHKPYGAKITVVPLEPGRTTVTIEAAGVEGVIAATKRVVSGEGLFLSPKAGNVVSYIDDLDTAGLSVYDRMHTGEASGFANNPSSEAYLSNVRNILFDNSFEIAILPVKTTDETSYGQETVLRVKHVNSDFSSGYRDTIGVNSMPVVFSAGLFGDLTRWEKTSNFGFGTPGLATQLAREGRDVWEIELMGGDNTDCLTCPNYTHEDLVDHYWPASIAGIQQYSGQDAVQYVAISHGCRVGLDAYKNWSSGKPDAGYYFDYATGQYVLTDLEADSIDTFVGAGCVGAFNGSSPFISLLLRAGNRTVDNLADKGHIDLKDLMVASGGELDLTNVFQFGSRISSNVFEKINGWVQSGNDPQPGSVSIDYFGIIYGTGSLNGIGNEQDDGIIPVNDSIQINKSISSSNEKIVFGKKQFHTGMPEDTDIRQKIKSILSKEEWD